jgi:hypothetical protein
VGMGYSYFYYQLFDFSSYLPLWKIAALFTSISMIICGAYSAFQVITKQQGNLIFSIFLSIITLGSIVFPSLYPPKFPDAVELPELFPAFVLPLHFIVPLFWLTFAPHFLKDKK